MVNYCIVTSGQPISDNLIRSIVEDINFNKLIRLGECGVELQMNGNYNIELLRKKFYSNLDFNIVTKSDRKKSLLLADLDGTILKEECIDQMAFLVGKGPEVQEITRKAMTEDLSFNWALSQRLRMLKGTSIDILYNCLKNQINIRPGTKILFRTFKKLLGKTAIVSGGFTFFTEAISKEITADFNYANTLEFEKNRLTGNTIGPVLNGEMKGQILKNLCETLNIDHSKSLAVGDGNNDINMVSLAGLGVAFNGSEKLKKRTKIILENSNLSAILYLLGIREEQFVN
ncbi:phosphoserine phosphatase SerB [bacterium TMED277]|nr:MAG: phosphoserine phosphatase SerB [bacterium TMED277]